MLHGFDKHSSRIYGLVCAVTMHIAKLARVLQRAVRFQVQARGRYARICDPAPAVAWIGTTNQLGHPDCDM